VDVRQPIEVGLGRFCERHVKSNAGVVDQIVDRHTIPVDLERVTEAGCESFERGNIAGIELKRRGLPTHALDLSNRQVRFGLVRVISQDDVYAASGKMDGGVAAESAASTGYQRNSGGLIGHVVPSRG
jgi:hypothetical protein